MYQIRLTLLIAGIFFCINVLGDVIPSNSHLVVKCIIITNINYYPDVSFVGFIKSWVGGNEVYIINQDNCLTKGYRMNTFKVFAVRNDYLAGRDLNKLDWENNENALISNVHFSPESFYIEDSSPLKGVKEFYKIAGFTDSSVVLYKWKEVRQFNNGQDDFIQMFEFQGNIQELSQQIATISPDLNLESAIKIYPNPARNSIHIGAISNFKGDIKAEMFNVKGKLVKNILLEEEGNSFGYVLNVSSLPDGLYFLRFHLGEYIEVRKVMIQ